MYFHLSVEGGGRICCVQVFFQMDFPLALYVFKGLFIDCLDFMVKNYNIMLKHLFGQKGYLLCHEVIIHMLTAPHGAFVELLWSFCCVLSSNWN